MYNMIIIILIWKIKNMYRLKVQNKNVILHCVTSTNYIKIRKVGRLFCCSER